MMMVNIVVEGHTEETFVNQVIVPHLANMGVFVHARRVLTSRNGSQFVRGGATSYARARRDISSWIKQHHTAVVTTMFDLYALPSNFPGYELARMMADPYKRVSTLETELYSDIGSPTFIPYIQLHEFEACLFTCPEVVDEYFVDEIPSRVGQLRSIRDSYPSPEHIDSGAETAPSKRIVKIYPPYAQLKKVAGPAIAARIGLERIRRECSHFDEWITRLEGLANT